MVMREGRVMGRPEYLYVWPPASSPTSEPSIRQAPPELSPPLIAMVVVVATAFLIVTYSRLISRYVLPVIVRVLRSMRRSPPSPSDDDGLGASPSPGWSPFFHSTIASYGLDESVIKTIPLRVFTNGKRFVDGSHDCAVCLLEFNSGEYLRVLPRCRHAFHVDCIDVWLRSHANCPLCRAGIFHPDSPFVPAMADRIRPSLDDGLLRDIIIEDEIRRETELSRPVSALSSAAASPEPAKTDVGEDFTVPTSGPRFASLKRSYSFGFESNFATERLVLDAATASPWRYRRAGGLWGSKRPSPFGLKPSVFSFRYLKSPFFRRRSTSSLGGGFFPLSESRAHIGASSSSRRSKSMTSPMFVRSVAAFSSSRLRSGDPEALLSPDRFNRR